jgi:exonuclease III
LLISETHFTAESYIKIPNYSVYHTNHPDETTHGGTVILIKHTTDHYQLQKYEKNHLQATSMEVGTLLYELTISAVYCPPGHNIKKEQFKHFFCTLGQRFLAGGDYNSKNVLWGSRLTTKKGKELANLMQDNNYSYLSSGTPTYWPTHPAKIPDLLDFF